MCYHFLILLQKFIFCKRVLARKMFSMFLTFLLHDLPKRLFPCWPIKFSFLLPFELHSKLTCGTSIFLQFTLSVFIESLSFSSIPSLLTASILLQLSLTAFFTIYWNFHIININLHSKLTRATSIRFIICSLNFFEISSRSSIPPAIVYNTHLRTHVVKYKA